MSVLAIGPDELAKIEALKELAAASPITAATLRTMAKGFDPQRPETREGRYLPLEHSIALPVGYCVTFTHEEQPPGMARHLSVSVDIGAAPPHAVWALLERFGFDAIKGQPLCSVEHLFAEAKAGRLWLYPERYAAGRMALNIVELIRQ